MNPQYPGYNKLQWGAPNAPNYPQQQQPHYPLLQQPSYI